MKVKIIVGPALIALVALGALLLVAGMAYAQNDPVSCLDILHRGESTGDGVYVVDPDGPGGQDPVSVYCDMTTDGGGWTLVGSSRDTTFNDQASAYYADLTTLSPITGHVGIWDGVRPLALTEQADIRFSCRNQAYTGTFDVDLAFYDIPWYEEITASTNDADVCFEEDTGIGQTLPPPVRQNLLTGESRPKGDQWNFGYLEGEDHCDDTTDFTVDFDDRGMDSDQSDGTDWGEDDGSFKCGRDGISGGTWFVWVRERVGVFLAPPSATGGGEIGASAIYTVTLSNLTGMTDTFALALSGNAWPTTLSVTSTGAITHGGSISFSVRIDVPPGANPGEGDVATVIATSALSPTVYSDTATLTTLALSGQYGYVFNGNTPEIILVDTVAHVNAGRPIDVSPYGSHTWRGALSPNGERLYVSLYGEDRVLVVDAASYTPVTTLTVNDGPWDVAFSADGAHAFVANQGDPHYLGIGQTVSVIDTAVPTVTAVITVGDRPISLASSPCLEKVYVTNFDDNTVSVIDVGTLSVTGVITGFFGPWDVAVSPFGSLAYVGNKYTNSIGVVDTANDRVIATWLIPGAQWISGLDLSPDGRKLYVADTRGGDTYVLDAFAGEIIATILSDPVGGSSWDVEAFPAWAGPFAYVSNPYDGSVAVININTDTVLAHISAPGRLRGVALFPPESACLAGIRLGPAAATGFGQASSTMVYTETLFNLTGGEDSFDLSVAGNLWPTTLSTANTGLVSDGGSISLTIQVEIPAGLAPGASDGVTVTAIAVSNPGLYSDTARLTTRVYRPGYVFNAEEDKIQIVDTITHQDTGLFIDTAPYGRWLHRGALSPDGRWLYASALDDDRVVVIDTGTLTPTLALPVGDEPHGIAFSADGAYAFVANQGDTGSPLTDTVSVIDTSVPTVTLTITVGDRPISLASSPCLDKVYAANFRDSTVSVIDVGTLSVTGVITGLSYPWGVAVSPLGDRVYVSNKGASNYPGLGSVGVIDTASDNLVATWPIPGAVWISGLDLAPDGRRLYVADANTGDTYVVDTSTGQVVAIIPTDLDEDASLEVEVFPIWAGPFAYVSNPYDESVAIIDLETDAVVTDILLPGQPRGLALFPPETICGVPPTAAFTPTLSVIGIRHTMTFTNQSTGALPLSYTWDFGDGSPLSTLENPTHTYNSGGAFTVALTATNALGWDTAVGMVQVEAYEIYLPVVLRDYP